MMAIVLLDLVNLIGNMITHMTVNRDHFFLNHLNRISMFININLFHNFLNFRMRNNLSVNNRLWSWNNLMDDLSMGDWLFNDMVDNLGMGDWFWSWNDLVDDLGMGDWVFDNVFDNVVSWSGFMVLLDNVSGFVVLLDDVSGLVVLLDYVGSLVVDNWFRVVWDHWLMDCWVADYNLMVGFGVSDWSGVTGLIGLG